MGELIDVKRQPLPTNKTIDAPSAVDALFRQAKSAIPDEPLEKKAPKRAARKPVDEFVPAAVEPDLAATMADPKFSKVPQEVRDAVTKASRVPNVDVAYRDDLVRLVNNGQPLGEDPLPTLKKGSKGPGVESVSGQLEQLGYAAAKKGDVFDDGLRRAVQQFQLDRRLTTADGIVGSETWGELSGRRLSGLAVDRQLQLIEQFQKHPRDPNARKIMTDVALSPGFRALEPDTQKKLLKFIGGANTQISQVARNKLGALLGADVLRQKPELQKQVLQGFMEEKLGRPFVTGENGSLEKSDYEGYELTNRRLAENHVFGGALADADADRYDLKVGNHLVDFYVSRDRDPKLAQYSAEEIAQAFAAMPKSSREAIDTLVVAGRAKGKNSRVMMDAGAARVMVYSTDVKYSAKYLEDSLAHESGHRIAAQHWGERDTDPRWDGWKGAIKRDPFQPTQYGDTTPHEDVAETIALYQRTRGTPEHDELRALYPGRFALLDELIGGLEKR